MTVALAADDIDVVPVGPQHAAALARLHAAAFADAWTEAAIARLLRADASRAMAAFRDHGREPVAFLMALAAADEAEILTIAVAEPYRRTGIARRLLCHLMWHLGEKGMAHLFLEVAADNAAAYGLYRRQGFVEVGRRKAYYQRSDAIAVDALILAVDIPQRGRNDGGPGLPTIV